jgi:hypothetical protein
VPASFGSPVVEVKAARTSGRTVLYGVDAFGRVNSVTGPSSKTYVSNITYKRASIPSGLSLANGLTETYT